MVGALLGVLCWSLLVSAAPFRINVGAVPGGFGGTDDGITRILNEVQIFVDNNTVTLMNLTGDLATVGTTGTFTDTGDITGTQFLPPIIPDPDNEGFLNQWSLTGNFNLTGDFEVVEVDGNETTLNFTFDPGGDLNIFYNETDGSPTGVSVIDAPSVFGEGTVLIDNTGGTLSGLGQATGGFTFTAGGSGTDLLDNFFLDGSVAMAPFLDNLTLSITDGNIAQTTTVISDGTVTVSALTDGSATLEMIPQQIPEPGTISLIGAGLLGWVVVTRRRLKKQA
jgi:hypothetical protein